MEVPLIEGYRRETHCPPSLGKKSLVWGKLELLDEGERGE